MDRVTELTEVLRDLLDWEALMGGWGSPCWARARDVLAKSDSATLPDKQTDSAA